MEPKPETHAMNNLANPNLGSSVYAPDSAHDLAAHWVYIYTEPWRSVAA